MVTCVCDAAGHELGRLSCGGAGGKRGSDPAYLPPYLAAHLGEDLAQRPGPATRLICIFVFCLHLFCFSHMACASNTHTGRLGRSSVDACLAETLA